MYRRSVAGDGRRGVLFIFIYIYRARVNKIDY